MPSAVHYRSTLTFQPWNAPKQHPYSSARQELKPGKKDERIAAMLQKRERNGGRNQSSKAPTHRHAASNRSSHQLPAPSHPNARTSIRSKEPSNRPRTQAQQGQPDSASGKRKATPSLSQRPAKRQRANAPELKDEAYIRSTMRMPTPQEYPGAPKDCFKNPKHSIYNLAQGLAECRSEITVLAQGAYQCTAYYTSAMHNQVVVGEGRTKVSRSFSCLKSAYNPNSFYRNPLKTPLGYTWWQSFTTKAYLRRFWTNRLA